MNGTWSGEQDGEDLFGYAEDFPEYYNPDLAEEVETYTGEDYPETTADRLRRARAMRAQRARVLRRAAAQRAPSPARSGPPARYLPPSPSNRPAITGQVSKGFERVGGDVQRLRSAVQNVDLESKLQSDTLARSLAAQRKRIGRSEYAFAASKVLDVAQQFPAIGGDTFLRTALPLAPLLLLAPERRGSGAEAFITDPRVWGIGAAAGLALFNHIQNKPQQPAEVFVTNIPPNLPVGVANFQLQAGARGSNGQLITGRTFEWTSSNPAVATVDSQGRASGVAAGAAVITVRDTVTGLTATVLLNVA
jgi:Bacterial Ig-like domain (group 2)